MYELTCPDCKNVMKTPFARVGAVATCTQCKRRFSVSPETLRRTIVPQPTDALSAVVEPIAVPHQPAPARGAPAEPPKPAPRPPTTASKPITSGPVGADLLDDDDDPDPESQDVAALASAAGASISKGTRQRIQYQRDVQRRQQRPILLLSLLFLILAGGITATVIYLKSRQTSAQVNTSNNGSTSQTPPIRALDEKLTLVTPERVPRPQWESINEPRFTFTKPIYALTIENDRTVRDAQDQPVLEANVKFSKFGVLEQAAIVITLVGEDDVAFARCTYALRNLTANRTSRIRLPIPQEYFSRFERIDFKAEYDERYYFPDNAPFESRDLILNVLPDGERTVLEIKTYNPVQASLERAMFFVTAFDKEDNSLGSWMLRWNTSVGERQPVQFAVIIPLRSSEIARWEVVGEGVPERKK